MCGLLLICDLRGNHIALNAHLLAIGYIHWHFIDVVSHSTVVVFIFVLIRYQVFNPSHNGPVRI